MGRNLVKQETRGSIGLVLGESEETLLAIPTPKKTESYTPIPYSLIINSIKKELAWRDFNIISTNYRTSNGGNRVVGMYKFIPESMMNEDLEKDGLIRTIAFRSSYDKTMAVGMFSGANVFVCENGVFSGDVAFIKKHISNVDEVVLEKIHEQLNLIEAEFKDLQKLRILLKGFVLSEKEIAQILGRLIFEKKILLSTQINVIKEQRRFSEYFSDNTAWSLYNNVTEGLKLSNPILFHKNHVEVTNFFKESVLN